MLSGNTGTRLDYSRINEITNTMKERLKKKYESASQMSADATSSANETPSDINVLDSYISDIENLFLNGIINGDLRVSGKIYADSVETANELINTSYIQNRNPSEVRSQKLSKQELQTMIDSISEGITWIRQNIKHSTIESSRLVRCQFFNPDFVNEVRFRDNTICEQKLRVGGTQDTNSKYALEVLGETYMNGNTSITGNLTVDSDTLIVDSSNNRVGICEPNPTASLDISGSMIVTGDITTPVLSGQIAYFAVSSPPVGWLKCNGSTISRTVYSNLFDAIIQRSSVTISIATPVVITWNNHGRSIGDTIYFTTTGLLPTGITANTTPYYIISTGFTSNSFRISASASTSGTAVNTSGTQSGTHTAWNAPFGFGDGTTTFNIPDLRGVFIRGFHDMNTLRETDTTRVFGSYQEDEFKSHTHRAGYFNAPVGGGAWSGILRSDGYFGTSSAQTGSEGGTETRPKNVALLACIKY
jgi:hypothetical protein